MNQKEKIEEERKAWKKRITELNGSGLTVTQFAKANGLSIHQIYYWKAKYSEKSSIQCHPNAEPKSPVIKVYTKSESKSSRLPDPRWVAEFIKAIHEVF